LELTLSARVTGDISCKVLAVEAGALVYGKIIMKGLEDASSKKKLPLKKRSLDKSDMSEELENA